MYRSDLVRAKKAALELSNEAICDGANISPMTLGKILKGEINIELKSLLSVAEFLKIPLNDLFSEKTVAEVV